MPVAKKKTAAAAPVTDRETLYPDIVVELKAGDDAITEDWAKQVLGWEELADGDDGECLSTDEHGKKFRCTNNVSNRPYDRSRAEQYAQAILQHQWAGPRGNGRTINGEAIVIGRTGVTVSCQHRLTGLIYACQQWEKDDHWRTQWTEKPVMDSVVVFGVDESTETTMTIDNVKPRSAADNFYADKSIFPGETNADRKQLCRHIEHAVRFVWHRTGGKQDAYSPYFVHTEALDFLKKHGRLLDAVKHIWKLNGEDDTIKSIVGLGTASGMMYLMGGSGTDPEVYRGPSDALIPVGDRDEGTLKFGNWSKAKTFWEELGKPTRDTLPGFKLVRGAIADLGGMDGSPAPVAEKIGMLAKAWQQFVGDGALTAKTLGYEYEEYSSESGTKLKRLKSNGLVHEEGEDDDDRRLIEHPSFGGPDYGDPAEAFREIQSEAREAKKEEERKLKQAAKDLKAKESTARPAETMAETLSTIRKNHPEKILLWQGTGDDIGGFVAWGSDALMLVKAQGKSPKWKSELVDGLQRMVVPPKEVDDLTTMISKKGFEVGVCGYNPKTSQREYLGTYRDGGYIIDPDAKVKESPDPVDPLPPMSAKKPKKSAPVETIEERKERVKAEGLAATLDANQPTEPPAAKPKFPPKRPGLKGGIG